MYMYTHTHIGTHLAQHTQTPDHTQQMVRYTLKPCLLAAPFGRNYEECREIADKFLSYEVNSSLSHSLAL